MPILILLQTCEHNLLTDAESGMGAVKANLLKEMKNQVEIIENSLKAKSDNDKGNWHAIITAKFLLNIKLPVKIKAYLNMPHARCCDHKTRVVLHKEC